MYDEVVKKILESLDEKAELADTYPKFSGEGYKAFKIDMQNFHEIEKAKIGKRIAFVDGGNSEIMGSASFSLSLMRICYAVYENNKKLSFKRFEILAFIKAENKDNEICYKASFFKTSGDYINLDEISFSSFDHTLMVGINRAEIGSVANAIRRFAELKLAKLIAEEKNTDIIVLDGNLQCTLSNENEYLAELYEVCGKNNILLAALSKTTSLFTDNGGLLSAALSTISPLNSWFYYPIAEISNASHRADIFFVKFHDKSRHVFRLEIFKEQRKQAKEIINGLAGNCTDPIFIGYPYGLVEADRLARISYSEKESLKALFLFKLQDKNIEKYLSSKNAHEILDRISF